MTTVDGTIRVHRAAKLRNNAGLAKTNDILREQLEYLIDHAGDTLERSCSECRRYLCVRSLLLQVFHSCTHRSVEAREVRPTKAA